MFKNRSFNILLEFPCSIRVVKFSTFLDSYKSVRRRMLLLRPGITVVTEVKVVTTLAFVSHTTEALFLISHACRDHIS